VAAELSVTRNPGWMPERGDRERRFWISRGALSCIRSRRDHDISSSSEEACHEVTNVISEAIHAGRPIGNTEHLTSRDRYRAPFRFASSSLPLERRPFVQIALHIFRQYYLRSALRKWSYSFLPHVHSSPAEGCKFMGCHGFNVPFALNEGYCGHFFFLRRALLG